ncbi:MAG: DUF6020 family protein [Wujia sp.]
MLKRKVTWNLLRQNPYICILLAVTSCAAMQMSYVIKEEITGWQSLVYDFLRAFHGWGIGQMVIVVLLYMLYRKVGSSGWDKGIFCFSLMLSVFVLVGVCYQNEIGSIVMAFHPSYILKTLVIFVGYLALLYSVVLVLWEQILQYRTGKRITDAPGLKPFRLGIFLLVCWIPYLILAFPGTVLWDTGNELYQFMGYEAMTNDAPVFQTILIGSLVKLGKMVGYPGLGVFVYSLLQMLLFIVVLVYMISCLESLGISEKCCRILALCYAFIPVFPLYAIAVGKDINFGIAILLLCVFMLEQIVSSKDFYENKIKMVILFVDLLLIGLFRNAGMMLVAGCLPVCIVIARRYWKRITAIWGMAIVLLLLWTNCMIPALGIKEEKGSANISVPLQQTARCVLYYGDEISESDRKIIDRVVIYDKLAESYNPEISDDVKDLYRESSSKEDRKAYYQVYLKQLVQYPVCYLDALLNKCYGYFYPDDYGREKGYAYIGLYNLDKLNDKGEYVITSAFPSAVEFLRVVIKRIREIPLLSVFLSCGFYTWIVLLCAFIVKKSGKARYLLMFAPAMFVLIGCIASPVNAYFRYNLPVVFMVPLLCTVAVYCTEFRQKG